MGFHLRQLCGYDTFGSLFRVGESMRLSSLVTAVALLLAGATSAAAFPIAPVGTEGFKVIVGGADPVVATYQGNSASFSNDLYLMLDAAGNPGDDGDLTNDMFIFNNHTSSVGSTKLLGSFVAGTELMFRLFVHNTGFNYFTGPADRNPDGMFHARVLASFMPGETLVSFEDLFNTPEGPRGFNDLSFSFTGTTSAPEPATVLLLGLGAAAGIIRRRRR